MAVRVSLIGVKRKKKRAIQLTLNAGFKVMDSITGAVRYRSLKIQLKERILTQFWDQKDDRPTVDNCTKDKQALYHLIEGQVAQLLQTFKHVANNPLIDVVTPEEVKRQFLQSTGQLRRVQANNALHIL